MDASPQLVNDRVMVPLRFVSEGLGAQVKWEETTNTVRIEYDPRRDIPWELLEIHKFLSNAKLSSSGLYYSARLNIHFYEKKNIFELTVNPYANSELVKKVLAVFYPTSYETVYENIKTSVDEGKDILNKVYDGRTFDCECVGIKAVVRIGKAEGVGGEVKK